MTKRKFAHKEKKRFIVQLKLNKITLSERKECVFCGSNADLLRFSHKYICDLCRLKIKQSTPFEYENEEDS